MTSDLPDINVLIALYSPEHSHHRVAMTWFESAQQIRTCPVTESGLVRLLMNPMVMCGRPLTGLQALERLANLRSLPNVEFISDDTSLARPAIRTSSLTGHRQVTDLHLLNIAVTNNATLVTMDARISVPLTARERHHVRVLS
ncbi:MAG: PIN domain-containing protein [Cellulomonadaceae bacterium]|jgi:toxin-antitoxin system PIN domain toxin|nr:PIN domain-containing protein [Cellulomonadaceae bacterium]